MHEGEIGAAECDYKLEADHGILSCLGRILNVSVDPEVAQAARAELSPQTKWRIHGVGAIKNRSGQGAINGSVALGACFATMHDVTAHRTMPRFVWMSPNWVSTARHIITARATTIKFRDDARREPMLKDINYVFEETFKNPPRYVSPDGRPAGFWHVMRGGNPIVGSAPLPAEYGEPDTLTAGQYIPIMAGRSRRRDCHSADTPWLIPIKTPDKGRWGCSRMTVSPTVQAGGRTVIDALNEVSATQLSSAGLRRPTRAGRRPSRRRTSRRSR